MTVQEQYTSTIRQAQDSWSGGLDSFAHNLEKVFEQARTSVGIIDANATIDQVFDFWDKALAGQREVTKQLVGFSTAVGEQLRTQAQSIGTAVREQSQSAQRVVREQAESAQQVAHEKARRKYAELTKAELQDELASRDLPKTGNVDELRDRLIADDEK
jgi:hypothetical protein